MREKALVTPGSSIPRSRRSRHRVEPNGWHLLGTHGENEVARIAPFEEIEIDLALLWGAPPS
jgi:hypothetical protein